MIFIIKNDKSLCFAKFTLDQQGKIRHLFISAPITPLHQTIEWQLLEPSKYPQKLSAYSLISSERVALYISQQQKLYLVTFQRIANQCIPRMPLHFINAKWLHTNMVTTNITADDYLTTTDTAITELENIFNDYERSLLSWKQQRLLVTDEIYQVIATPLSTWQQMQIKAGFAVLIEALKAESETLDEYAESLQAVIEGSITNEKANTWGITTRANSLALRTALYPSIINQCCGPDSFYSEKNVAAAQAVTIADIQQYLYQVLMNELALLQPQVAIATPEPVASSRVSLGRLNTPNTMRVYAGLSRNAEQDFQISMKLLNYLLAEETELALVLIGILEKNKFDRICQLVNAMRWQQYRDEQLNVADELTAAIRAQGEDVDDALELLMTSIEIYDHLIKQLCSYAKDKKIDAIYILILLGKKSEGDQFEYLNHLTTETIFRLNVMIQGAPINSYIFQDFLNQIDIKEAGWLQLKNAVALYAGQLKKTTALFAASITYLDEVDTFARASVLATTNKRTYAVIPSLIRNSYALSRAFRKYRVSTNAYFCEVLFPAENNKRTNEYAVLNNYADLQTIFSGLSKDKIQMFVSTYLIHLTNLQDLIVTTKQLLRVILIINNPALSFLLLKALLKKPDSIFVFSASFPALQMNIIDRLESLKISAALITKIRELNPTDSKSNLILLRKYLLDSLVYALKKQEHSSPLQLNPIIATILSLKNQINDYKVVMHVRRVLFKPRPKGSDKRLHYPVVTQNLNLIPYLITNTKELATFFNHCTYSCYLSVMLVLFPHENAQGKSCTFRQDRYNLLKTPADYFTLAKALSSNGNIPEEKLDKLGYYINFYEAMKHNKDFIALFATQKNPRLKLSIFFLLLQQKEIFDTLVGNRGITLESFSKPFYEKLLTLDPSAKNFNLSLATIIEPNNPSLFKAKSGLTTQIKALPADDTCENLKAIIQIVESEALRQRARENSLDALLENKNWLILLMLHKYAKLTLADFHTNDRALVAAIRNNA